MKRAIKFGGCTAVLNVGEHRAMLTVYESSLPTILADAINEAGDIDVTEVSREDNNATAIRIVHDLSINELLDVICEAISKVYDADTFVSNARAENVI